jgi:hypothetical protein
MRKSIVQALTVGEQTQKEVSDVFRHWSGTGKSYCRTRSNVGSERVNHPHCSPVIFLFPVVLTFSKMRVIFGTMDRYALRQVYLLSKTYRITVLTFSISPLKCPFRTVFSLSDEKTTFNGTVLYCWIN